MELRANGAQAPRWWGEDREMGDLIRMSSDKTILG